jgi:hypothetical protein
MLIGDGDPREGRMETRPMVWALANSGAQVDQQKNLEKSALFLLLVGDRVDRDWGNRRVPPPAVHDKRIQIGIGLVDGETLEGDEGPEANQHYLALKADTVHFHNPKAGHTACHELTAQGMDWAQALRAEAEDGCKPWLLDWKAERAPRPRR